MTDVQRLRAIIYDRGRTMKSLAGKIGITPQSFSYKMTGKTEFSIAEAVGLKRELQISDAEFMSIFFAK